MQLHWLFCVHCRCSSTNMKRFRLMLWHTWQENVTMEAELLMIMTGLSYVTSCLWKLISSSNPHEIYRNELFPCWHYLRCKTNLAAQPLLWKWFSCTFLSLQFKLISKWKFRHQGSFSKRGNKQLGNAFGFVTFSMFVMQVKDSLTVFNLIEVNKKSICITTSN